MEIKVISLPTAPLSLVWHVFQGKERRREQLSVYPLHHCLARVLEEEETEIKVISLPTAPLSRVWHRIKAKERRS